MSVVGCGKIADFAGESNPGSLQNGEIWQKKCLAWLRLEPGTPGMQKQHFTTDLVAIAYRYGDDNSISFIW